jgi:hypothetical protein
MVAINFGFCLGPSIVVPQGIQLETALLPPWGELLLFRKAGLGWIPQGKNLEIEACSDGKAGPQTCIEATPVLCQGARWAVS